MDGHDLLPPCYSPFLAAASSSADGGNGHQYPALDEFLSCDASDLEKLLANDDDDVLDNRHRDDQVPQDDTGGASSLPPAAAAPPPPVAVRRRPGRKPGSGTRVAAGTTHVEAERQRRDRLNRLFCDLRAAVPTVTRMDKASLLADAVGYIATLRRRIEQLQAEQAQAEATRTAAAEEDAGSDQELEVWMMQQGRRDRDAAAAAALRLTTTNAARHGAHAPARLMAALRALDLPVQHASVCRVGGVTVQDVVVDVPAAAGLRGEDCLRTALLHELLLQ